MATQPYEILMRRNGQSWALHARQLITLDDGTVIEGKAVPLAGLSDPAFAEVATLVGASKDNEIATLTTDLGKTTADLAKMTAERDTALAEKASLQTLLDSANATIETLTSDKATIEAVNTELTADLQTASSQLESATTQNAALQSQVAQLQARIDELENPPNPFPNSDWQGFRSAALASPVIMRMAVSNIGNFMMLLIYLTEMQKDPATSMKMAAVWNEMETKTPLSTEEIASINALAANYQVPMVLNSEGQIVLP